MVGGREKFTQSDENDRTEVALAATSRLGDALVTSPTQKNLEQKRIEYSVSQRRIEYPARETLSDLSDCFVHINN